MIEASISIATADLEDDLRRFEGKLDDACRRICDRIGLATEALAVENITVASGRARDEIRWTGAKKTADGYEGQCIAYASYSIYIEMGFQGHFVPFKISDDLYREALTRWGWRVPKPSQLLNKRPGERYLIPRGRNSPTAGVYVSGKAKPFLRPAIAKVNASVRDRVTAEELRFAIRGL